MVCQSTAGGQATCLPSLNLPEQRLTAIEKQLVERTRELLSVPVQRSTKRKNEPELDGRKSHNIVVYYS